MMKSLLVVVVVLALLPLAASGQSSTLVVPGKSVGPISLEMSLDQIKGILGEGRCEAIKVFYGNVANSPEIDAIGCQWGNRAGFLVYEIVADSSGQLIYIDRQTDGKTIWKTVEGVQFGDEQGTVIRIYGQPDRFWIEERGGGKLFRMRFANGLRVGLLNDSTSSDHRRVLLLGVWRPF